MIPGHTFPPSLHSASLSLQHHRAEQIMGPASDTGSLRRVPLVMAGVKHLGNMMFTVYTFSCRLLGTQILALIGGGRSGADV